MHTLTRILFILLLAAFIAPQMEAQILGRLKRKIERKLEDKVEDEVDKALSKEVDKELNQDTSLRKDQNEGGYDRTGAALLEGMIGSKMDVSNVSLPEEYRFQGTLTYEITSGNDDPMEITYLFPIEEEKVLGFQMADESDQYFVWDLERDVIVMYTTNSDGSRNIMKLPNMTGQQMDEIEEDNPEGEMAVEATGKVKKILGYRCEEYKMTNEESEVYAWITKEFPLNMSDFYELMAQQSQNPSMSSLPGEGGMALEIISYTGKKKKDKAHMIATGYSAEEKIIDNNSDQ